CAAQKILIITSCFNHDSIFLLYDVFTYRSFFIMACQNVFRRYELKYLLDEQQHTAVMKAVHAHMIPDRYAHSAIRSLYFDTDNYRLARHSIEKPVYKEKLRLRSYGQAGPGSTVF